MSSSRNETDMEEKQNLLSDSSATSDPSQSSESRPRPSSDSLTSTSTTSLVLENLDINAHARIYARETAKESFDYRDGDSDPEEPRHLARWHKSNMTSGMVPALKRTIWILVALGLSGWLVALFTFISSGRYKHTSSLPHDFEQPKSGVTSGRGKTVTLDSVLDGYWGAEKVGLNWISGPSGEDGLLLEAGQPGKDFLVVEDVRSRRKSQGQDDVGLWKSKTLMKSGWIPDGTGRQVWTEASWPSPDLKKVLVLTRREKLYRHSFTGIYYVFDVASQTAEPLDADLPEGRIQLAQWSMTSDAIAFTRDHNFYVRMLSEGGQSSTAVRQVTSDGGPEFFYGVPDWVYEEEVFQTNIATWWDREGKYVAFTRTNETMVPEYPVEYFISRPSGVRPSSGSERYPDEVRIKYPKAGAPNPVVDMLFYDIARNEMFDVDIDGGFKDDDRIIGDVMWADNGKVLVKEFNRVSDRLRLVQVDVATQSGKEIRSLNVKELDGGWIEPAQTAMYVPADAANGRPQEGYVDMVIYENNDHLAYFSPLDASEPTMLTKGNWEVETGTANLDLKNNLVYFTATKQHSTQRHVYSVDLQGTKLSAIVPTDKPGYYTASFSDSAGYAIITYEGPGIPHQELISTPSNPITYKETLTSNAALARKAAEHELPTLIYTNLTVPGSNNLAINVVERRPPHFDPSKKYPVLFFLYGGPGSQQVTRKFTVDFQSYVASSLDYIVVTVDGRGTGYIGRDARTIIRGQMGHYEALDQIMAAKHYASLPYVDADRLAIWGWSYGGYMTLKTLETDAGRTFKYGMSVAPVTDWRFYDSIYTERYMFTPQENNKGYEGTAINNVTALAQNVRWLMMHGVSDDNVHLQNTLTLIDKLDVAGIKNYDVHFFPDSDHGIYFHGANRIVYEKLNEFLIGAFNGLWYERLDPKPNEFGPDGA